MAEIFDTSIDYIVGYTDIKNPIDRIAQRTLNEDECNLLNNYRCLTPKQQHMLLGVVMGIKSTNN